MKSREMEQVVDSPEAAALVPVAVQCTADRTFTPEEGMSGDCVLKDCTSSSRPLHFTRLQRSKDDPSE